MSCVVEAVAAAVMKLLVFIHRTRIAVANISCGVCTSTVEAS